MVFGSHPKRTSLTTRRPRLIPSLLLLAFVFLHTTGPDAFAQRRRPAPRLFGATQADEWKRLEQFARYLRRRPAERGHVVVYTPRVRTYSARDAEARFKDLKETLFERWSLNPVRVSFVDGGLREEEAVEFWVLPRGASPPEPTPTAPREALLICPRLYANSETFMLRLAQPLTFSVTLYDGDPAVRPTFRWAVSRGRILSGQGERMITVGGLEEGAQEVTASVEVGGLPAGCESRRTAATGVGVVPYKVEEYGNIRSGDMKARLDNFVVSFMQKEPELVAYVVAYGGRRGRRNEARNHADRAADYLTNARGLEPERVQAVYAGLRESLTVELWVSTRGGPAPAPAPTVAPKAAPRPRRRQ